MTSEAKKASLPASPLSDEPRQKRETPRLQPLATNRHRASQPMETAMTSELRPAVEVFRNAVDATGAFVRFKRKSEQAAAAVIEADREAVRAEQAAELAKFRALAETLAGYAVHPKHCIVVKGWGQGGRCDCGLSAALRQYKEATQ